MEDYSHILTHLGEDRDQVLGAVNPPIYYSSNFAFNTVAEMRHALTHEMDVPFYTRGANPTVAMLRKKLAALEGSEECLVFSSGSAAIAAAGDVVAAKTSAAEQNALIDAAIADVANKLH